jgi:hypothetical protein
MKYLITESKLNSAIYEYIDQLFHEGKKIEMVKHTRHGDDTDEDVEVEVEGAYDFFHKGEPDLFTWTGKEYYDRPYNSSLFSKWSELAPIVEIAAYEKVDTLNNMFGDLWRPIFIKWFEDLFLLPIKTLK